MFFKKIWHWFFIPKAKFFTKNYLKGFFKKIFSKKQNFRKTFSKYMCQHLFYNSFRFSKFFRNFLNYFQKSLQIGWNFYFTRKYCSNSLLETYNLYIWHNIKNSHSTTISVPKIHFWKSRNWRCFGRTSECHILCFSFFF